MSLKVGDKVKIPSVSLGHDKHKKTDTFTIEKVYTDGLSVKLKNDPSIWPISRLKKV